MFTRACVFIRMGVAASWMIRLGVFGEGMVKQLDASARSSVRRRLFWK